VHEREGYAVGLLPVLGWVDDAGGGAAAHSPAAASADFPITNALGACVFLGTPFYVKKWEDWGFLLLVANAFLFMGVAYIMMTVYVFLWKIVVLSIQGTETTGTPSSPALLCSPWYSLSRPGAPAPHPRGMPSLVPSPPPCNALSVQAPPDYALPLRHPLVSPPCYAFAGTPSGVVLAMEAHVCLFSPFFPPNRFFSLPWVSFTIAAGICTFVLMSLILQVCQQLSPSIVQYCTVMYCSNNPKHFPSAMTLSLLFLHAGILALEVSLCLCVQTTRTTVFPQRQPVPLPRVRLVRCHVSVGHPRWQARRGV